MDPKQKEGQNNSGTLSTGANISRTMDSFNNRKSATSNSPFAKHQFNKVAPQTGDILLSPSNNYVESKKGFSINRGRLIQFGLIFGAVALVALVIVTVVLVINKPKDNTKVASATSYQEAYNRYANWMINGTESFSAPANTDEEISKYYMFSILNNVDSTEEQIEYFETAKQYYSDFENAFNETDFVNYPSLVSTVASSSNNLDIYLRYLQVPDWSENELLETYLLSVEEFLNNATKSIEEDLSGNLAAEGFVESARNSYLLTQRWFELLQNNSCIENGIINDTCRKQLLTTSEGFSLYAEIMDANTAMYLQANDAINKVIADINIIGVELQQPTESEEYSEEESEETLKAKIEGVTQ